MTPVKICRFIANGNDVRIGLEDGGTHVRDLSAAGVATLSQIFETPDAVAAVARLNDGKLPRIELADIRFAPPVERQEVWAAGVTYLRSKKARMEESEFSASAYDRVYEAERPEIFFKSMPEKVVATGEAVGIRRDAKWNVPEPELALVLNSRGKIVGHTIGNDMSSRDIEGENLLYLPQAKTYHRSCALGPWITLGTPETAARAWTIKIQIQRDAQPVFTGETSVGQIKRRFEELAEFLFRCQVFPHGAVLLTGTGVVPADTFTLQAKDEIIIEISGIGTLRNAVEVV